MDKEREIEELNNTIADFCIDLVDQYCGTEQCCTICMSRHLIEAGYRKLNDDDIVLTKAMQDGSCEGMDDRILEFFKKHNAEVRKETAKEILLALLDKKFEMDSKGGVCIVDFYDELNRLFEKYGVEVDE